MEFKWNIAARAKALIADKTAVKGLKESLTEVFILKK